MSVLTKCTLIWFLKWMDLTKRENSPKGGGGKKATTEVMRKAIVQSDVERGFGFE